MRLNPFAFPSDTTFRFLLFIAAIIGVSLLAFDWLYSQFADLGAEAQGLYQCLLGMNAPVGQLPTDDQQSTFLACMADVNEARRTAVVAGVVALLLGGVVAYGVAVAVLRRRYRPLREADAPELWAQINALSGEAGMSSPPGLRWQPIDVRALGLAFGPPGRRELAFTGGLVPLAVRDPPAFRSIVLHELAHIRNRDVDLAYYAIGIWRALVVVAIIPFVVTLLDELVSDPGIVGSFGWRLLALVPLVYLVRAGILRAREHDADVRASTHEPEIRRVLAAAADRERPTSSIAGSSGGRTGWLRALAWRRHLAWHPTNSQRVAIVDDPAPLLRLGVLDALGVGIVGSLAYEEVATLVGYFGLGPFTTRGLAALAFGPLVGLIVALGTWRQTFAFLATGRGPVRIVPLALALVGGLLIGQRLGLTTAISGDSVLLRPDVAPFHLGLTILVGLGAILFIGWLVATSRLWLPVATRLRSPTIASLPVAVGAAAILAIAIAVFEIVVSMRELMEILFSTPSDTLAFVRQVVPAVGPEWLWRLVMSPEIRVLVEEPLIIAGFLIIVTRAVGGSAPVAPHSAPPGSDWGALDPDVDPPTIERPELRPRWALGVGLAAGIGIAIGSVFLHAWAHAGFDAVVRDRDEFLFAFAFWTLSVTLAGQLAGGVIAAARAVPFGTLHGMLAGLVAGIIGTLVEVIARTTSGCVTALTIVEGRPCGRPPTVEYIVPYLEIVLTVGLTGAAIGAAITTAVRRLASRRRSLLARTRQAVP